MAIIVKTKTNKKKKKRNKKSTIHTSQKVTENIYKQTNQLTS